MSFITWTAVSALTAHMASVERLLLQDDNTEVAEAIATLREQLMVEVDHQLTERE